MSHFPTFRPNAFDLRLIVCLKINSVYDFLLTTDWDSLTIKKLDRLKNVILKGLTFYASHYLFIKIVPYFMGIHLPFHK